MYAHTSSVHSTRELQIQVYHFIKARSSHKHFVLCLFNVPVNARPVPRPPPGFHLLQCAICHLCLWEPGNIAALMQLAYLSHLPHPYPLPSPPQVPTFSLVGRSQCWCYGNWMPTRSTSVPGWVLPSPGLAAVLGTPTSLSHSRITVSLPCWPLSSLPLHPSTFPQKLP